MTVPATISASIIKAIPTLRSQRRTLCGWTDYYMQPVYAEVVARVPRGGQLRMLAP